MSSPARNPARRRARLVLFVDSRRRRGAVVADAVAAAARARDDVEVVAAIDTARGPPPRHGLLLGPELLARRLLGPARPEPRSRDSVPTVRGVCRRHRIPLWRPPDLDVNGEATRRHLAELRADLALSILCVQIFRPETLALFRAAANWHPGRLPAYRGVRPTSWELYHGEREGGFAYHLLVPGIDEGPVLVEGSVPIPPGTPAALVDRAKARAAAALAGALLEALVEGRPGRPQQGPARYFSRTDAQAVTRVPNPSDLTFAELERRLRAFGALELGLLAGRRRVTAIRRRERPPRRRECSFTTADGVVVEVTGLGSRPLALARAASLRRTRLPRRPRGALG